MTMLAGVGSRLGALVAQRAVQVAAAGLLSGAVAGGAVVAAGLSPFDGKQTTAMLAILACPGSGPELAHIPGGQTLLVTARSGDGHWLEVYVGEPGVERGWAQASALRLQSAPDGLPVGGCVQTAAVPSIAPAPSRSPSPEPGPSILATVGPSPTPAPTLKPGQTATPTPRATPKPTLKPGQTPTPTPHATPTPTPTPTPTATPVPTPPDLTSPTLSNLHDTNTCLGPDLTSTTMIVNATDPDDAVSQVSVSWHAPGAVTQLSFMHWSGSNWQLNFTYNPAWSSGYISYTVTGTDTHNNNSVPLHNDNTQTYSLDNFIIIQPSGCIIG
jgi:hypothetical protein